nr:hypothetical protein BaRGS_007085 [Batillaria attramentaria]
MEYHYFAPRGLTGQPQAPRDRHRVAVISPTLVPARRPSPSLPSQLLIASAIVIVVLMSGVAAAAIAAAVVAVGGASDADGDGGGGGGGGEGGGSTYGLSGHGNVTGFLVDVMEEVTSSMTPAAMMHAGNASSSTVANMATLLGSTTLTPDNGSMVVISVILGALILCTIIGNCLVCISVGIVKRLQTPSNLLIVSLAVADLLVAILVMPLAGTMQVYGHWALGERVCDMWTTTDVLLCTASILNLCAISVDRYLVITRPFQYAMKRTPRRMGFMIFVVWGVSAVVSIPPVFGWKSPHQAYDCFISQDIGYQIYATLCAFYLPLFIMIFVYFKIWLVSSKIAKAEARSKVGSFDKGAEFQIGRPSRDSNESQFLPNGSVGKNNHLGVGEIDDASLEILPKGADNDRLKRRRFTIRSLIPRHRPLSNSREQKATKTLGIIMGCFTLCWLPFFILALYKTFCLDCYVPPVLDGILMWLGYANSFLNPVIYARFNRDFRTPFKEILCFRCRGINVRMRSESYVEQYGGGPPTHRDSLRPPMDCVVRYNSQGQTVVQIGNGSANSQSESKI